MTASRLDRAIAALPRAYPGPGGAVAVLREGQVLVRHAWGYANAERRIPFTPRTLFRMCSITKQFTCAVMLDMFPDPSVLDQDVRARLPLLAASAPGAAHLAHNQSGLRDYWAEAMLLGSPVEAPFGDIEAQRIIAGTRSLHFAPGTRFSYVNQNFRILSDILQDRAGRGFADLLHRRVFDRVGMEGAVLTADTRAMPDGTEGYEGTQATGFRAAENRILWTGDAGLGASLHDMIAWETHIDATRDYPGSLYQRLSDPVSFSNGAPAAYGFGLSRWRAFDRDCTGHGGALRGWRSHRVHVARDRVSVVVMFNHLGNAAAAAMDVLAAVLDAPPPLTVPPMPHPDWCGAYLDPETGLAARIEPAAPNQVRLWHGHSAETLDLRPDGSAGAEGGTRLIWAGDTVRMERPGENRVGDLVLLASPGAPSIAGEYRCDALDATLSIEEAGGVPYGAFGGFLGRGRMELLDPVGRDVWALPCPRALDHTPPGDWTLAFQRDASGEIERVTVGCWLARGLVYRPVRP